MTIPTLRIPLSSGSKALVALGLVLLAVPIAAAEVDSEKAQAEASSLVRDTLDAVIGVLKDEALSDEQKQKKVEEVAYSRFDFATITRLVLARNWRKLSDEQRDEFVIEFQRHLSLTYGETLKSYKDEKIEIDRTRLEKKGDVTVRTKILGAGADPYLVDYRLRRKEDSWWVIDVIIEGVSLVQNFRTQTQEIISDVGANGLIERLRKKNDERETKLEG